MRPVIIVYAKAPIPGNVKTRLIPKLGAQLATQLHHAFVEDTLVLAGTLSEDFDVELHTDIATEAWSWPGVRSVQSAGDLSTRMYATLQAALAAGRTFAMIVGSDSPTLPPHYLTELAQLPADVVFGPARDGGYYAIGCRSVHPSMFDGVTWSSARTLVETELAAHRCGLRTAQGSEWFDVDQPRDLDLLVRSEPAGRTGRVLREYGLICSR